MNTVGFAHDLTTIKSFFNFERSGDECMFLIMNSVFPAKGSKFITERFDLKGSTVGR